MAISLGSQPFTLYGRPIVVQPDTQKRKLSEDVPVTEEFRAEINNWMLQFFGYTNIVDDGQVLCVTMGYQQVMLMNPRTYRCLQNLNRDCHEF